MAREIFKTDTKFWTQSDCDQIEVFFQFSSFFSSFYQHKDFDNIVAMTYYTRVQKANCLLLQNSKRPIAIILLSGQIDIQRKVYKQQRQKRPKQKNEKLAIQGHKQNKLIQQYEHYTKLLHQNSSSVIDSECKVVPLNQTEAQVLFVPSILYNEHMKKLNDQRLDLLVKGLKKFFPQMSKKELTDIAQGGCCYRQYRMNQFVYRAGSVPDQVYLLMQGNIKLEKPGFSAKKMFEMVILNPLSMFGQKDIKLTQRQQSAISCSAYARTLFIPKKTFLKIAKQHLPQIDFLTEPTFSPILPSLKKNGNSSYEIENRKPKFKRFHSTNIIQTEKKIESKLIKNCHILVNLSPKGSKTSRLPQKKQSQKDYTFDQFQGKFQLFRRIRPNSKVLDFTNPLIETKR